MKVEVLGVQVDDVNYSEAVEKVKHWWKEGGRHYIVTPNSEMVVYAASHPDHLKILNAADMSIPDGAGVVWASRVLGKKITGRVTGTDLAEKLIGQAVESGESVFFLGGVGGVAEASAKRFVRRFPNVKVTGWAEGDASSAGDIEIRKILLGKRIGLLLVAYGAPKQEYWISRNLSELDVKVAMGIGGAFDFWSGKVKRAPRWMQTLGLEWLFRLIQEPGRIKRQIMLPVFVVRVLLQSRKI